VGPRAGLDVEEERILSLPGHEPRSPGHRACSLVTIPAKLTPKYTVWVKFGVVFNVEAGGTYSYHSTLND
jgi:hypothetical protein